MTIFKPLNVEKSLVAHYLAWPLVRFSLFFCLLSLVDFFSPKAYIPHSATASTSLSPPSTALTSLSSNRSPSAHSLQITNGSAYSLTSLFLSHRRSDHWLVQVLQWCYMRFRSPCLHGQSLDWLSNCFPRQGSLSGSGSGLSRRCPPFPSGFSYQFGKHSQPMIPLRYSPTVSWTKYCPTYFATFSLA